MRYAESQRTPKPKCEPEADGVYVNDNPFANHEQIIPKGRKPSGSPRCLRDIKFGVLRRAAKALKIPGYSKYGKSRKDELLGLILGHERLTVRLTVPVPTLECLTLRTPVRPSIGEVWRFRGERAAGRSVEEALDRMQASPQLRHHISVSKGETDKEAMKTAIRTQYGYGLGVKREEGLARVRRVYERVCGEIAGYASRNAEQDGFMAELLRRIEERG